MHIYAILAYIGVVSRVNGCIHSMHGMSGIYLREPMKHGLMVSRLSCQVMQAEADLCDLLL